MTPDPAFVAELAAFDPDLRVRWSTHRAKLGRPLWIIERKIPANAPKELALLKALDLSRHTIKKMNHARTVDLWHGAREGYAHIMDVHPGLLAWSRVAPELAKADAWRVGGMKALADAQDAELDAEEKTKERAAQAIIEKHLDGVHDHLQWEGKRRISTYVPDGADFTVTDRRAVTA